MGTALVSGGLTTLARALSPVLTRAAAPALTRAAAPALTRAAPAIGHAAYHGPPALTLTRAFTEWTFDPWMTAFVVILGGGYLTGARRRRVWPVARRCWCLGLGLVFLVIATMGFVGASQPVLMYARALQTVLL